ncbi:MAG: protein-disulfide reductase DsbD family protein [Bryobacterales bacterium]
MTELGGEAGAAQKTIQTDHLRAAIWSSDAVVRGGNRLALGVDIELAPKMHVYAPGVEGYLAIDWTMDPEPGIQPLEVEYPEARRLEMPAIQEVVPVYEGKFRLIRDVHIGQPNEVEALLDPQGRLNLRGKLRYQACDDKICYLPKTLDLSWTLAFEQHDRTRAPEELRR